MSCQISFRIDVGKDEQRSNQTERRDAEIYHIPAHQRSEDVGQVSQSRHISVDQSYIMIIPQDHILKYRTEYSLEYSAYRYQSDDKSSRAGEKRSSITKDHSQQTYSY